MYVALVEFGRGRDHHEETVDEIEQVLVEYQSVFSKKFHRVGTK